MEKQKIIVVVGPTAAGKTALGIKLAEHFNGEVVSADSMQVYKNMPIASAAVTKEEMGDIPHHLVGILEPTEKFSVAEFIKLAEKAISDIAIKGKLPIIVGGTGLYIDSLINGIDFPSEDCSKVREELEARAREEGIESLFDELKSIDPKTAEKLHLNDKKRIIRALEVYYIHNKTMSELNLESKKNGTKYEPVFIGITYENRELLYDRINCRVDIMLENGLIDEAKAAYESSFSKTAVQAIGHKELFPYFKGEKTLQEALETLKQETRRYAKRQLTWFRRNENINWIYADKTDNAAEEAIKIIEREGTRVE